MNKRYLFVLLFLASLSLVMAQAEGFETCTISFDAPNTAELILSIPLINSGISSCEVSIPEQVGSLIDNKNILITLNMDAGSTQNFYLSIVDKKISSISTGMPQEYSHNIILSENTLDNILASQNILDALLLAYNNDEIVVDPVGVWNNVVWFFASWFI